ncbi:hypothetical protein J2X68_006257 [Streptomyces sp. 3330]|uniref:hypothetical protein n=1 Tax=Streptomyces sp. 3330 TaxID=2817755 RepID=UPI00285472DE|nr:hypothetical protein [Streptomyces sp. 3330]MDR6979521.1 hypothetical protein [Streptomyces sp. 3330]
MTDSSTAQSWERWWEALPEGVRRQVDGYVLQDARMRAIRAAWEAGRAHGVGLHEAQLVVHERYLHHGDRIARTPDDPLDLESLAARAAGAPGRVVAIEVVWDGDTFHDWFVVLYAVTADPEGEHPLATVHGHAARQHLDGTDPALTHPCAAVADKVGRALAARLSVPFHFASPHTPDDEAPRLRPS